MYYTLVKYWNYDLYCINLYHRLYYAIWEKPVFSIYLRLVTFTICFSVVISTGIYTIGNLPHTDYTTSSSWPHDFVTLTNKTMFGLKVTCKQSCLCKHMCCNPHVLCTSTTKKCTNTCIFILYSIFWFLNVFLFNANRTWLKCSIGQTGTLV